MAEFDLIIRGGTVVTAADRTVCDVAVKDGKVVRLGLGLEGAAEVIDARGKLVLPGGIDSHCHIAQAGSAGVETADDFRSGSISAACGGTTTIIPFAAQYKGQSLRKVVEEYHARADGEAVIDYAFHLIISDPSAQVMGQELPALIRDGCTSFKVYMTYESLKLDDRQMLEVLACARREGAMVMIHAENHDVIAWLTERLLAAGHEAAGGGAHPRLPVRNHPGGRPRRLLGAAGGLEPAGAGVHQGPSGVGGTRPVSSPSFLRPSPPVIPADAGIHSTAMARG